MVCVSVCARTRTPACVGEWGMPGSIRHSLQRSWIWFGKSGCHWVWGFYLHERQLFLWLTLSTLAKYILKPVINKCLKDTSIQQHMFRLLCTTMGVPHQLSSSSGFLPSPPTSPAPTVPVTQCQMGSESSADPPLCGGNPQSFSSGLQVTEAVMKNSELILTSLLKVKRASHYPPCFSVNTKAAVAKRRNASLLCSCWKLFGLYCGDSELRRNTWKNRRERSDSWITESPREWL